LINKLLKKDRFMVKDFFKPFFKGHSD